MKKLSNILFEQSENPEWESQPIEEFFTNDSID